jgi:UDP-N-acetylglucosamine:LPS N-acetylglucosamine transferase
MLAEELEDAFHRSKLVLCRSGYSSIMDLEALNAKAFFVPTPGQYEQQYLAKRMKKKGIANFVQQDKFSLEALNTIEEYSGFGQEKTSKSSFQASLFDVFK